MNTDELAASLATNVGLKSARALQRLGLLAGQDLRQSLSHSAPQLEGPQPILDWHPVDDGGQLTFERARALRCKPKVISAPSEVTLRVCVIGESLAAGFPMAPLYSPSIALEERLKTYYGVHREVEVIDLALPNMGPSEQLRVAESARQLKPDVFVFMTGNNWHYGLSVEPTADPDTRGQYALNLSSGGVQNLKACFRQELARRARVILEVFSASAQEVGAQMIVAIPPVNHAWARRGPLPWLTARRTQRWLDQLETLESSLGLTLSSSRERPLSQSELDAILEQTRALSALEGQVTGIPETIESRAHLAIGDLQRARDAALKATDAINWHTYSWALPQVPTYVAALMRELAEPLNYDCIDIAAAFTEHTGEPYHDFRLFLDQCHLTVEGVQVAMSAVADAVYSHQVSPQGSYQAAGQERSQERPPGLVVASGLFQGAHWTSQFYPSRDTREVTDRVADQLRAALDVDARFKDTLLDLLRFNTQGCSPDLHARFPAAVRLPGVGAALSAPRLNPPQLKATLEVLKEVKGDELEQVWAEVIASHQASLIAGVDLARPQFGERFWEHTPRAAHDPTARHAAPLYRALWPDSRFACLTDGSTQLSVNIVARSSISSHVKLVVNETEVGDLELTTRWRRYQVSVPSTHLSHGLNHFRLMWSVQNMDGGEALSDIVERMAMGVDADLFPIFGEVFQLKVTLFDESDSEDAGRVSSIKNKTDHREI